MDDNHYETLGVSPESAMPNVENITSQNAKQIETLSAALTLIESYSDTGAPKDGNVQAGTTSGVFNHPLFGQCQWTATSFP